MAMVKLTLRILEVSWELSLFRLEVAGLHHKASGRVSMTGLV
jgi:hypothetical protein